MTGNRAHIPRLAIILPCLDEEQALPIAHKEVSGILRKMVADGMVSPDSFLMYIDDGSTDSTWDIIKSLRSDTCRGVRLSRNFGHQYALLAGIESVIGKCDACVTIDVDLQDDPGAIPEMVRKYSDGAEIVYGVRNNRKTDTPLKRSSAHGYYSMLRGLGVDCVYDHADFRLLGSDAMSALMAYEERNVYLRGIVPLLGYKHDIVEYKRSRRTAGKSKYPLGKMIEFAADGLTSFSVRPVRWLFWLGIIFMAIALAFGIYVMVRHIEGETIAGWTSTILSIWFCTGLLLMGLGILGEYVGKIYIEVKKRPRYNIAERI